MQIERVKAGQKRHSKDLISMAPDVDHGKERRRIGRIHDDAGNTPTLDTCTFACGLNRLGLLILQEVEADPEQTSRLYVSLQKIARFDMVLSPEAHVDVREQTIEIPKREMNDIPTSVLVG